MPVNHLGPRHPQKKAVRPTANHNSGRTARSEMRIPMLNPLTHEALSAENAEKVRKFRQARRTARHLLRSGNPAKRADGHRLAKLAPRMIARIYASELQR